MTSCQLRNSGAETQVSALLLDLDGTLLNTEKATESVLQIFLEKYGKVLDTSKEDKRLGKMFRETAASLIEDYGLPLSIEEFGEEIMPYYRERWPHAKALPGANRLIKHLHKHGIPFALASNSIRSNIEAKISYHPGWKESFSVIIGGDEVESGKPSPHIFLEAAKKLGVDPSRCMVIEDSLVGVTAAKAAKMKVVAVPSLQTLAHHFSIADSVLHSLLEFQPEIWGLPPFEDWVHNTLPIEPLYVKCIVRKQVALDGYILLNVITDHSESRSRGSLPDQMFGVYFGWGREVGMQRRFKVVMGIAWETTSSGTPTRVIQSCLIGGSHQKLKEVQLELFIVGYIRQLNSQANICEALEMFEEDMSRAEIALDLPIFINKLLEF